MTQTRLAFPSSPARRAAREREIRDLGAIDRLLRALARLRRCNDVEGAATSENASALERLLAKLNATAERMIATRRAGLADADGRPRQRDGEAALDVTDGYDFIADSAAASSVGLDIA